MDRINIRDKIITFLVPVVIIILVGGILIGVIGKTYFWDISHLTIQVPGESTSTVHIKIQARLLYFNIDMFGLFRYPVRIMFPFSRTQTCGEQCVFDRLPHGDAFITVVQDNSFTPTYIQIRILPDTKGTIDLRPKFTLTPISVEGIVSPRNSLSPETNGGNISGEFLFTHTLFGLEIYRRNTSFVLYDMVLKQSFLLPEKGTLSHIARGENDLYLVWYDTGVYMWDRYGQIPTKEIQEILYFGVQITWSSGKTFLEFRGEKKELPGTWSPMYGEEGTRITNGQTIMWIE